uniref:Uncharacterized protein n=1 Tax=Cannabis sativa TaxID=3483 RepID=A0A803QB53_CANSA
MELPSIQNTLELDAYGDFPLIEEEQEANPKVSTPATKLLNSCKSWANETESAQQIQEKSKQFWSKLQAKASMRVQNSTTLLHLRQGSGKSLMVEEAVDHPEVGFAKDSA